MGNARSLEKGEFKLHLGSNIQYCIIPYSYTSLHKPQYAQLQVAHRLTEDSSFIAQKPCTLGHPLKAAVPRTI